MRRLPATVAALSAGATLALGSCGESRPVIEPSAGIILEKYTEDEEVCYMYDPDNFMDCQDFYEATITHYYVDIGACALKDDQAFRASREYLAAAAKDPKAYPITDVGFAKHEKGMDPAADYSCTGQIEVDSADFDRLKVQQFYVAP